nr:unnamed protein product [Callosobruchus analis]
MLLEATKKSFIVIFLQFLLDLAHLGASKKFCEKHQLPEIIGVIDCTHVAIVMPSGHQYPENIYVNRKDYQSVNVQLVSKGKAETWLNC